MGSTQPLVKLDNTPAKQAQNRRYEVRVRFQIS
jgi:outer membrane protein OmpA-like peptidoglycan-associated protein